MVRFTRSAPGVLILATLLSAADYAHGEQRAMLRGHSGTVTALAITPRGLLASASMDHKIKLWDLIHFRELSSLTGHQQAVRSLAFTPDARRLASGASDRTIRLWDMPSPLNSRVLGGTIGSVFALAFTPDALSLASSAGDGTVKIWDVASGNERAVARPAGSPYPPCLAFSPDGHALAWADANSIRIWDVQSRRPRATLAGHLGQVVAFAFALDGRELYSASADGSVRAWDPLAGSALRTVFQGKTALRSLALRIDGKLLAAAETSGVLTLIEPQTGALPGTVIAPANPNALVFSPSGRLLISGHADGVIYVWQLAPSRPVVAPGTPAAKAEPSMRHWTSADGLFQVEAQLMGEDAERILLRRKDGKEISVTRGRLCARDLDYLRSLGPLEREDSRQAVKRMGGLTRSSDDKTLSVDLSGRRLPDSALARLEGMPHLESLNLSGTYITDKGLAHVAKLTRLKRLDLSTTNVTDAAAAELKKLVNLESLNVTTTFITDAGYQELKKSMPRLRNLTCAATTWRVEARQATVATKQWTAVGRRPVLQTRTTPGGLMLDMPRVRVLFEEIAVGNQTTSIQLQIAGIGRSSGTWKLDKVSGQTSYAKGVGRIELRADGRTHTLELQQRGTRLIVDGRRGFELEGEKITVAVRQTGARIDRD
jgi:WD40 repeat protein